MKPVAAIALVGLLGATVGSGASLLISQAGLESSPHLARLDGEITRLGGLVEQQSADSDRLVEHLEELQRRVAQLPAGASAPLSLSTLDAAIERALAARLGAAEELAALADELDDEGAPSSAADYFARLAEVGSGLEHELLWQQIREAGLADEVVAMYAQLAADSPYDPELQIALGVAYLEKLTELGQSPLAGMYAAKADAAFDAALDMDETNWDARFTKAVALSFWPPIFGKQPEAVKQFEILLEQQKTIPDSPQQHAQTYLLLGNLYSQMGHSDKALDTWVDGLDRYPDDADLAAQIASAR